METLKSYTDIDQSKKLAEILPIESADMHYSTWTILDGEFIVSLNQGSTIKSMQEDYGNQIIPCWSLSALLSILPFPNLSKDNLGGGKVGWMVSVFPDNCRYDSHWHADPVEACIQMIVKLNELKLL